MEQVSEFKHFSWPVGAQNSIVRLIEQFRDFAITENDIYLALRKRGFNNDAAVDYVRLIASTRF